MFKYILLCLLVLCLPLLWGAMMDYHVGPNSLLVHFGHFFCWVGFAATVVASIEHYRDNKLPVR